jgi:hypothetical protein
LKRADKLCAKAKEVDLKSFRGWNLMGHYEHPEHILEALDAVGMSGSP